jgi:hypothetical protein
VPNFTDLIRPTEQVRGAWSAATHERLLQVKRRFDPDNVFRTGFAVLPDEVNSRD